MPASPATSVNVPSPLFLYRSFSTEIVHYVEVRPPILVVVAPSAAETIAVIILTDALGDVGEGAVTVVVHQEIGRSILRVMIWQRVLILTEALVEEV